MRPDASENSQISPSTIVWAARAARSHPHLASVLLQGRNSANIHASSGVIRGIPAYVISATEGVFTRPIAVPTKSVSRLDSGLAAHESNQANQRSFGSAG